jgi:SNF2 family DNA or RNA helicase
VDECSSIKNPKAQRTKGMLKLARLFKYRRIMTGTPASNGPLNLYSQAEFLKPYLLRHSSYYSFKNEYCVLVDMMVRSPKGSLVSFKKITGYRNLDKLKTIISSWSSSVNKDMCLDLPPKIYETYHVEMPAEQRRLYDELRERSIVELSSESTVTAALALTKVLRLQQLLCGYLPDEEGVIVKVEEGRLDALMEIIEEMSGKVIIWSRFIPPIRSIEARLKKEYGEASTVTYHGETKNRGEVVKAFQEGEARFFVGNPQTAGYGITLTAATNVIYYASSFDLEHRLQSEDRCYRIGQTKSVTYVDMVCRGTVDEKIVKALREKRRVQDMLLAPDDWKSLL